MRSFSPFLPRPVCLGPRIAANVPGGSLALVSLTVAKRVPLLKRFLSQSPWAVGRTISQPSATSILMSCLPVGIGGAGTYTPTGTRRCLTGNRLGRRNGPVGSMVSRNSRSQKSPDARIVNSWGLDFGECMGISHRLKKFSRSPSSSNRFRCSPTSAFRSIWVCLRVLVNVLVPNSKQVPTHLFPSRSKLSVRVTYPISLAATMPPSLMLFPSIRSGGVRLSRESLSPLGENRCPHS